MEYKIGMIIEYVSKNGYSGKVIQWENTQIYTLYIYNSKGERVLHSYRSAVDTLDKLKDAVNGFPQFMRMLDRADVLDEDAEDDGI